MAGAVRLRREGKLSGAREPGKRICDGRVTFRPVAIPRIVAVSKR